MTEKVEKLHSFMVDKARLCGRGTISVDDFFNFADEILHFLESAVSLGVISESEKGEAWKKIMNGTRREYLHEKSK